MAPFRRQDRERSDQDLAFERYVRRPSRRRLAAVVRAFHGQVWAVAMRLTGNRDDAADLCQDVFLELLLRPPARGSIRSPSGYLSYRVVGLAQRLARSEKRRRARETRSAAKMLEREGAEELDVEALREALASLPERTRAAMELKYLAGCSTTEIAQTLEVSERTVATELQRGRDGLRRRLGEGALGAALLAGTLSFAESTVPVTLEDDLLRVVEMGDAVLAPGPSALSGAAAGKSVVAFAATGVVLLVVAGGFVAYSLWQGEPAVVKSVETEGAPVAVPKGKPVASPPRPAEPEPARPAARPPEAGAVRVLVFDIDGDVVEGAVVGVRGADAVSARTDAAGLAVLDGLAPGERILDIRADGHGRLALPGVVVESGPPGALVEATLEEECLIAALATDHQGKPLEACSVTVSPRISASDPRYFKETGVSDRDGRVSFGALAPGVYAVIARFDGRRVRLFPTPHDPVDIGYGDERIEISFSRGRKCAVDVVVYSPVRIAGRVLAEGETLAGAVVALEHRGEIAKWKTLRSRLTKPDGQYRIFLLAPGSYVVTVRAPTCKTLKREIELPARDLGGVVELDFELEVGGVISGRLVREGRGFPGKVVLFKKDAEGRPRNLNVAARTTATGRFAFQHLANVGPPNPDGRYVLRGLALGVNTIKTGYERVVEPLDGDVEVEVRGSVGPSGVSVEALQVSRVLRGRVVTRDGPVPGRVELDVTSDIGNWKLEAPTARAQEDGSFEIRELPAAVAVLDVIARPAGFRKKRIKLDLRDAATVRDLGDIVLDPGGDRRLVVRISYLDLDADPELGTIHVLLQRVDAPGSRVATVTGGKATFENLDPGKYRPRVDLSSYLVPEIETVDLTERAHAEVVVGVDPGVTLRGNLVLGEDVPVYEREKGGWLNARVEYSGGESLSRILRLAGDEYRIQGLRSGVVAKLTLRCDDILNERLFTAELPGFVIDAEDPAVDLGFVEGVVTSTENTVNGGTAER